MSRFIYRGWVAGGPLDGPDWRRAVDQEANFFSFHFLCFHSLSHEQVQAVFSLKVFRCRLP